MRRSPTSMARLGTFVAESRSCVTWLAMTGLATAITPAYGQPQVPPGFQVTTVASGFQNPVGIAFAPDGRIFVAETRGRVWVVQNDQTLPEPFIDLRPEVNGQGQRGLLGLALDPDFLSNRHVYLLYTVDPVYGKPDEPAQVGTFGRLTRYTGTPRSDGNIADLDSRLVLIGAEPAQGIPVCETSHTIGSVRFANDGSLFISAGDGAHALQVDAGGLDPECFGPGMFGEDENIGAFRSQYLGSLAGKILRVDAATGLGLPSNPYWTGDGQDKQSKIWASGLRNPFRFSVKPGSGDPGTLYIGDVGWNLFEEINVAAGGENFGWPCYEGAGLAPEYPKANPAHSGCDSIGTPDNPGPLTSPLIYWHHSNGALSCPTGITGRTSIGGVFYAGARYPPPYQDAYFFADYAFSANWIKAIQVDEQDRFIAVYDFATNAGNPVDFAAHPITGDLYYVSISAHQIRRIGYPGKCPWDLDASGTVGILDLLALLAAWGTDPGGPPDFDGDGTVGILDLLTLLANWGACP